MEEREGAAAAAVGGMESTTSCTSSSSGSSISTPIRPQNLGELYSAAAPPTDPNPNPAASPATAKLTQGLALREKMALKETIHARQRLAEERLTDLRKMLVQYSGTLAQVRTLRIYI